MPKFTSLIIFGERRISVAEFDLIIKNGMVVDGTGTPGQQADVAIVGDKIAAIGRLEGSVARKTIDATGKVVCPGFIDTHSHSDLLVLDQPYIDPKVRQGVTTEVIGQDGMSLAPVRDEYLSAWKKAMAGLEGSYDVDWDWRSVREYLDRIESMDLGPNFAFLAPHGNIRLTVMGLDNREPTPDELEKMQDLLSQCLREGAFGLSTGMIYPPCCYAKTYEFVALGKVLADAGAVFVTHQRSEADDILNSADEILKIGRESGCRVHFSHFKVAGKKNWSKIDPLFEKLDRARADGMTISFDQYPYVAGSTMLGVILPPWAHDGGTDRLLERLKDPVLREKMKKDIREGIPGWDNFVDFAGLDGIFVTFVKTEKNQDAIGKNLVELGEMRGKEPLDAAFDLLLEEENVVGMVDFYGTEEHVVRIMTRPEQNVSTDGIMGAKPHPRLYGTFPRILGKYVREEKVMSLETAIYKMTGKPASVLGLKDRGILKEGFFADVVIFDPQTVKDTADYVNPRQYPVGIEYVFVNGKMIVECGQPRPQRAGKVLRFSGR